MGCPLTPPGRWGLRGTFRSNAKLLGHPVRTKQANADQRSKFKTIKIAISSGKCWLGTHGLSSAIWILNSGLGSLIFLILCREDLKKFPPGLSVHQFLPKRRFLQQSHNTTQ
jgi:hypothetical protein